MLFKKMLRTIGRYKAQFISMILMVSIGVGVFIGFNMEWLSLKKGGDTFYEATKLADYRLIQPQGFSQSEIEQLKQIEGVKQATRFLSVNMPVPDKENLLSVCVNEDFTVSTFMVTEGEAYDPTSEEGIWLSDRYAKENHFQVGQMVALSYQNIPFEAKIKGLIKASEYLICIADDGQLMPDYLKLGFAYLSPAFIRSKIGFDFYPQIHIRSDLALEEMEEAIFTQFNRKIMMVPKKDHFSYSRLASEIEEGKVTGSILPALFLLISLLTMITTMHRLTRQEKIQIGILKALGFKDSRIIWHYTSFGFWVGLFSSLLGLAFGFLICWLIINPRGAMATYLDLPEWKLYVPNFCWFLLGGVLLGLSLVSFLSVRKVMRGTPAQTLRPYLPKKVKSLLIEKTRFWKKADFAIRWNLRDIFRYKTRSLMSLVGVFGCVTILLCAFGIKDTVDDFTDLYYQKIINYKVKIDLVKETPYEEISRLAKKYNAVFFSSSAMKFKKEVVPLEIYDTPNERVRFVDEKDQFILLPDDGVLISLGLAKKYQIKVGDTINIEDYAGDGQLSLKVAGISRMMSKAFAMSKEYAKSLSFSYQIDALFSDVQKEEVESDPAISNVQTKEDLMSFMNTFMTLMNFFIFLFVCAAIILAIVVLYNLGIMGYTERYRELATLKIVGFKDKKIAQLLVIQNLWITIVGMIIGFPLGMFTHNKIFDKMFVRYDAKVIFSIPSSLYTILLTLGVSLLVSLLVARKNKQIDMVGALKMGE